MINTQCFQNPCEPALMRVWQPPVVAQVVGEGLKQMRGSRVM